MRNVERESIERARVLLDEGAFEKLVHDIEMRSDLGPHLGHSQF